MTCPLSNVSFLCWIIQQSAKTNADQLDFHRALALQQEQTIEQPSLFPYFDRPIPQDPLYQKAYKIAMYLLKNFGGREINVAQQPDSCCTGVYDYKNCSHVDLVAAFFCACKFVGTQDIMFVSYDSIVVKAVEEIARQNNDVQQISRNQDSATNDGVAKASVIADPSKKINLFVDSDEEGQQKQESIMKRKSNANSEDDIVVEKKGDEFCHDDFVEACVRREKDFMRACSYFADVPEL